MKRILPFLGAAVLLAGCVRDNDPNPAKAPLKLKSITYFLENQQGDFRPGEKTFYSYDQGRLVKEEQFEYDSMLKKDTLFSTTTYSYHQNQLVTIVKRIANTPQTSVTHYEYSKDKVSKIILDDDVDTEAAIQYLPNNVIEIKYTHSNGRWFIYRFSTAGQNIGSEQTFDDSQRLASKSTHEFDKGNNPMRLLGYTDLYFTNFSVNNKLKTESEYFTPSQPQSSPVAYEYEYNSLNYPIQQITTYKSNGSGGAVGHSKTVFEYQ